MNNEMEHIQSHYIEAGRKRSGAKPHEEQKGV